METSLMDNLYEYLFISLVSSGSVVAVAIWFLKRYLGGKIDHMFVEREKILDHKLTSALKYEEKMIEVIIEVVPRIQEVVYRSRNLMHKLVDTRDRSFFDQLLNNWESLSEYLFQYQLFMPKENFDRVHEYKNLLYRLLTSEVTTGEASDTYSSAGGENQKLLESQICAIKERLPEIDRLYEEIVSDFRGLLDSRKGMVL